MSSQSSVEQPPRKKLKISKEQPQSSSQISKNEIFSYSQSLTFGNCAKPKEIVIKKGDKISRRITQLQKLLSENEGSVLLMSSGDAIQKMVSIVEILKSRLRESQEIKYKQLNKLDHYDTVVKKNEILEKRKRVSVLYTLVKKIDNGSRDGVDNDDEDAGELKSWTQQDI